MYLSLTAANLIHQIHFYHPALFQPNVAVHVGGKRNNNQYNSYFKLQTKFTINAGGF